MKKLTMLFSHVGLFAPLVVLLGQQSPQHIT